jgi:branched-chain amino acid transport system permease protein
LTAVRRVVVPLAVLAALVLVPYVSVDTHGVFSSDLDSPGSLQLLGLCLVFGAVALSYDLLFGFTGLLSFGHALYFAIGAYVCNIALTRWEWSFWQALLLTAAVGLAVPLVLGSISLRVTGIAFAMVTLAFAQAGNVLVHKNPDKLTGGDEGLGIGFEADVPSAFIGVFNTQNLYWLALGYAAAVFAISAWAVSSSPGRVWQAIRENELRVQVLGLRPFWFKLLVFVLASFLATAGGVVYLLLIGSSSPGVTTASFTLALLIMVVLGGTGTLWGPMIGGFLYTFLDSRLVDWSANERVQDLPEVLETPLSEPLFVLGVLFILVVYFLPGGIAGVAGRRQRSGLEVLTAAVQPAMTPEAEDEVKARL